MKKTSLKIPKIKYRDFLIYCAEYKLQNPITSMLGRHDADVSRIKNHISELARVIKKQKPLLIYLYQSDVKNTIDNVKKERPVEWFDFVTNYITEQGFGKRTGLIGYEGVIDFFEFRREIECELLKEINLNIVIVDNSEVDWTKCNTEIKRAIDNYV